MVVVLLCREAIIDPKAQNIELNVRQKIPTKFNFMSPVKGFTRITNPVNPNIRPIRTSLVRGVLKIIEAINAPHNGIVEFNNAVIPEDKYCAPNTNRPCPPKIVNMLNTIEFLKSFFPSCLTHLGFLIKETNSKIEPEIRNLIPNASKGGIISITTLIARKLEPHITDNVMSTNRADGFNI